MRELRHQENLAAIAEYCHTTPSEALGFVRGEGGLWEFEEIKDDRVIATLASTSDFHGRPRNAGDIELAEWAAARVRELTAQKSAG